MSEERPADASPFAVKRSLGFEFALGLSLAGHLVAVLLLWAMGQAAGPRPILQQRPVNARLVRLGPRRDKALLPRLESAPPPPPAAAPVPLPLPAPAAAPAPAPTPAPAASAAPSLKPRAPAPAAAPSPSGRSLLSRAFKTVGAEAARSARFSDALSRTAKAEPLSGDPDGDVDGDSETAEEGERYFGLVLAKARRNYGITKTIARQELDRLKVTVVLYIGPVGELLRDPEIQTSSGREQFDQDVIHSLKKAAPFGPPPAHMVETLRTVGVAIEATP